MTETPSENVKPQKAAIGKGVSAEESSTSIASNGGVEAKLPEPLRLHPDDIAALQESREQRPYFVERAKAWIAIAERTLLLIVLVAVIGFLGYVVSQEIRTTPVLVIEPFEVPESFAQATGLTGRAIAGMLRGEMTRIGVSTRKADSPNRPQYVAAWENPTPVISVPGTGLTLDSVLRYIRENEPRVTGALLVEGDRGGPQTLRLHVHVSGRPDMLGDPVAPTDFKAAIEAAAIFAFRNTYDIVYASYLNEFVGDKHLAESELRGILSGRYIGNRKIALNILGNVYSDLGQLQEAVAWYQRAVALDPAYGYAHNNLGIIYNKLGRHDEAIEAYQRAIALDPEDDIAYNNLGATYTDLDRYDEAIEGYQRAIALNPADAYTHNNLGLTYNKLGRHDEAIDAYQRAIALDPENGLIYKNLGNIFKALDRHEEAELAFKRAAELQ